MTQPRAIILADGESKPNHMRDRHFLDVGGEELLPRIVRQFDRWAATCVLTSNPEVQRRLDNKVSIFPGSDKSGKFFGIDMIRKGLEMCGPGRNIIVFGDVYFTDAAVETIKQGNRQDWAVYGRSGANEFTGTRWAEYFAIEVAEEARRQAWNALEAVASYYVAGEWGRCTPWEWYFEMEGLPYHIASPRRVQTGAHWVEINDLTDDIDVARDLVGLRRAVGE